MLLLATSNSQLQHCVAIRELMLLLGQVNMSVLILLLPAVHRRTVQTVTASTDNTQHFELELAYTFNVSPDVAILSLKWC